MAARPDEASSRRGQGLTSVARGADLALWALAAGQRVLRRDLLRGHLAADLDLHPTARLVLRPVPVGDPLVRVLSVVPDGDRARGREHEQPVEVVRAVAVDLEVADIAAGSLDVRARRAAV